MKDWASTGDMGTKRSGHTATLLANGQVLVAGGYNGSYLASGELYDPADRNWSYTSSPLTPRSYHTATLLPSGQVLVAGGSNNSGTLSSAQLYNPATGTSGPPTIHGQRPPFPYRHAVAQW